MMNASSTVTQQINKFRAQAEGVIRALEIRLSEEEVSMTTIYS